MLLALVFLCAGAWWWWRQWRLLRLTKHVPTYPGALPLIGHAHQLMGGSKKLFEFFDKLEKYTLENGGVVKFWIGPAYYFVVTDPKIAFTLLQAFEDKASVYKFTKSWIGDGLLNAEVPKWRRFRKILNPTFNQHMLDQFIVVFNEQAGRFIDLTSKELGKGEFDPYPYLERNFLEIICRTALGLSKSDTIKVCNDEYGDAVRDVLKLMCSRFQKVWLHPTAIYNLTKTKREEDKLVKILKKICYDVLLTRCKEDKEENNNEPKKTGLPFKAFLDQLLEFKSKGLLTDQDLHDEVNTMIMGGSDTTARASTFLLMFLGANPVIQDRVYNEIQEVLGGSHRDILKEDLSKFVYMEAVIKESLRIFPIVPLIARNVDKNYRFGDMYFPTGSTLVVFISGINRNKCWGDDVDQFRPERWLEGPLPEKTESFAPFSLGRRQCIGKHYAMMSMKTFVAHVLCKYRIHRKRAQLKLKCDGMLRPVKGHHISLELR